MAPTRTRSMELRAIRQQMQESPPPPPHGTTVREWFTGLALMNPELMRGLTSQAERVDEAIRLADELIRALQAPRAPSQESIAVPQTEEGLVQSWNGMAGAMKKAEAAERQRKDTVRPGQRRSFTQQGGFKATIPPPPHPCPTAAIHFKRASDHLLQRPATPLDGFKVPGMGAYSSLRPEPTDE